MRKFNGFFNVNELSSYYINYFVNDGDTVLDATVGNGKDSLKLAKQIGDSGYLIGFDIQSIAINNTDELLKSNYPNLNYKLYNECHSKVLDFIEDKLDFAVMNLGYLPGGNKNIVTKIDTTLASIEGILRLLKAGAFLVISAYVGHEGGKEEQLMVDNFLSDLDQSEFNVIKYEFHNQKNSPAIFYSIEKSNEYI